MPATTSGADAGSSGAARSRTHNQGNQDRSYTVEQKAAVLRIRRCNPTAFYDILGLEEVRATVTETEIKKAYRKISLLTHPDKNGHEHADEAFKMVSRAFGVLGDKEKKQKYDRYGGDPDSRFGGGGGGGGGGGSPFAGFSQRQASAGRGPGGGNGMWEEEISPEEMFNRFFGGGFGGGGGMFNSGPQFVFNMGGGPGFRVHQFGGAQPRRRPRDPNQPEPQQSLQQTLIGLLPILFILVLPLLSSLFSGSSTPSGPKMTFDAAAPPYTMQRTTPNFKVKYFVNPADVEEYSASKLKSLDKEAENTYVQDLRYRCENEQVARERMIQEASGIFWQDRAKIERAHKMEMKGCDRLEELRRIGSGKQRA